MAKAAKPVFSDILDTPATEVQRPQPAPQGTYKVMNRGHAQPGEAKTGTPYSEYTLQIVEPTDDVDEDALIKWLTKANGDVTPLKERFFKITFYNTADALWRHKRFLYDLGIEEKDEEGNVRTIGEMAQEAPGRFCWAHIKHTPSRDGESMYANVDRTAPIIED